MDNRIYHIRISPEAIQGDIFTVPYDAGPFIPEPIIDPCCDITTTTTTSRITGYANVYSSMTQILSGGTNGTSLLTGLTVPIFLTQHTVDMGYYSEFDGLITQKDVLSNFLFSASTSLPFTYYFYNTSDLEFKKFLSFLVSISKLRKNIFMYLNNINYILFTCICVYAYKNDFKFFR